MSLLELKNIGKIYVSQKNVSVGIRGVNLSLDRGEFVAITGKSGSGKSTLLNVISGMDTYEEGEMYVAGEPTSHYIQSDWEEYRKKYISFIFQDYNIIDSFTVLQNVELALMDISNPIERRKRAIELLKRVGLERHLHHKGSKLSGGQKQRTVIARALAKDSPIILADEPTGNLDSETSKEIIQLLQEISKDKLVIVVTHNFEQVQEYATRHIRIYDGAVEADQIISTSKIIKENPIQQETYIKNPWEKFKEKLVTLGKGFTLGRARFKATPKLSTFLCLLMSLSAIFLLIINSSLGYISLINTKNYLFNHYTGRTVISRQDGKVINEDELSKLVVDVGAKSSIHYDILLDTTENVEITGTLSEWQPSEKFEFKKEDFSNISLGEKPIENNEVILRVPISYKNYYDPFLKDNKFIPFYLKNLLGVLDYKVTGISYFYDNTKTNQIVFTEQGYKIASAIKYFSSMNGEFKYIKKVEDNQDPVSSFSEIIEKKNIGIIFALKDNEYYYNNNTFQDVLEGFEDRKKTQEGYEYTQNNYLQVSIDKNVLRNVDENTSDLLIEEKLDCKRLETLPNNLQHQKNLKLKEQFQVDKLFISAETIYNFIANKYYDKSYTQASIFFNTDKEAKDSLSKFNSLGYVAIASTTLGKMDTMSYILNMIYVIIIAIVFIVGIVFIGLFIALCSSKTMQSTKGDVAILRSMGISVSVIKISSYAQMLISLIPAYISTAIGAVCMFCIPELNAMFKFIHAGEYVLIAVSLLLVSVIVSRKYIKKTFNKSVKKTLKEESND